jgi:organic hydroperoxide reductase OsmC/OhrA
MSLTRMGDPPSESSSTWSSAFARGHRVQDGQHTRRFHEIAEATNKGCPVSQALEAVPIELTATVVG